MAEGLSLGPLLFRWSGILVALGLGAGFLLTIIQAKFYNYDPEIIYDVFLHLIFWGILGARLWHILTPPLSSVELGLTTRYYFSHPLDVLAIWVGGFGIPGAIIGGLFALFMFTRKQGYSFWVLADLLAPGLALAQAIGRVGNYFSQELYGLPTNLPWKIFIEPSHRLTGFETIEYYHPLFAYEAILSLANLILLIWLSRRFTGRFRAGGFFLVYLGFYSATRLFLEFLRLDVALVNGINVNQVFFTLTFVCAVIFIRRSVRKL
ncbi:MAG: prolipoprotein diacylglyceryl transferase [Chloroflexi bacterium]|nr:prolipoprotein diacylglyceryl transferase [Chloroflexota bacterium]